MTLLDIDIKTTLIVSAAVAVSCLAYSTGYSSGAASTKTAYALELENYNDTKVSVHASLDRMGVTDWCDVVMELKGLTVDTVVWCAEHYEIMQDVPDDYGSDE